ncbi:hypothetical protein M2323_003296 [Rhodoblastus acidophilus]|uniref:hypothetical protein n=1 Tax=Rhodoblastus acidophilus TaxID=1074 RepID=UPI00222502ED|nr:hypothetical protein [Rhodoblastus acidophilus]MCW2285397.1 hypothetical protein [Rhodoblastus acidophilus]MCW2334355.1 hypothetical protein [Rhodoblastus acidophilus]
MRDWRQKGTVNIGMRAEDETAFHTARAIGLVNRAEKLSRRGRSDPGSQFPVFPSPSAPGDAKVYENVIVRKSAFGREWRRKSKTAISMKKAVA